MPLLVPCYKLAENGFLILPDDLYGAVLSVTRINVHKCLDYCLSRILNCTLKCTDTFLTHYPQFPKCFQI